MEALLTVETWQDSNGILPTLYLVTILLHYSTTLDYTQDPHYLTHRHTATPTTVCISLLPQIICRVLSSALSGRSQGSVPRIQQKANYS